MIYRSYINRARIGILMTLLASTPVPADVVQPRPIVLADVPLLFADDSGVASRPGATRTIHAATTAKSPVIEPDQPWEGGRLYLYGSVYADETTGQLRMWYNSCSTLEQGSDHVLFGTSTDGLKWTKPSLQAVPFNGSLDNNIVFNLHSPSVLLDKFEKDPAKRYKMLGCQKKTHKGYDAAWSADGMHWTASPNNPVLESSDTITLSQDASTGEYLAYHKRPTNVRGFRRRVVWLSRSKDFETWSPPELVYSPDEIDDAWVRNPQERTEIYNLSVFPHAAGFIGLPTIFHVTAERPKTAVAAGQSPLDGPIDVQLLTSADGSKWERTTPRVNVIPRGEPGTFDGGAILGVSSTAVQVGDHTWVYYTAINTGHGAPIPPKRLTIGRAEWRRHGFASLDADPTGAVITTKPIQLSGKSLIVNADAARGELRVALLEADGTPIIGFEASESIVLNRDETRWAAAWRSNAAVPIDRPVQVVIQMRSARLYSLSTR